MALCGHATGRYPDCDRGSNLSLMLALVRFAMRGRSQAALVAATAAVLSVLPFVGVLAALVSAAVIALATLRNGLTEGLFVAALAGLGGGVLAWLALTTPAPAIGFFVLFWGPVWLLAVVLGWSRSLALAIEAAAALALLALAVVLPMIGNLADLWRDVLEPLRVALIDAEVMTADEGERAVSQLATWMPGLLTATIYVMVVCSLLLARWWQALLDRPGAFGAEFQGLRFHRVFALAVIAAYALVVVTDAFWPVAVLLVLALLLMLQGLAVIHSVVRVRQVHAGWLIALYGFFVIGLPLPQMVIAGLGLADAWADFRRRLGGQGKSGS